MIEVELRGLLSKEQHDRLIEYLKKSGDSVEADNKTAYYFNFKDGILKAVREESKNTFKLSLKKGNEFSGMGMEEREVYLASGEDLIKAIVLLEQLGFTLKSSVPQKRMNILYKKVHFAAKHTPSWGYHFEAEMIVESPNDIKRARVHIKNICNELGLETLSESQLRELISNLESK